MKRRKLIWQLLLPSLTVALAALAAVAWYASTGIQKLHREVTRAHLEATARLVVRHLAAVPGTLRGEAVQELCRDFGVAAGHRFTVILPNGQVVADSENDPYRMHNHSDRPEIRHALSGGIGTEVRYSDTLRANLMYVALPITKGQVPVAVVRTSMSLSDMDAAVAAMRQRILVAGLVTAVLTVLAGVFLSRRISRPLREMCRGADAMADGDLTVRLPSSSLAEIQVLAEAMNHMAAQLERRINAIQRQRDEYDAVLAGMTEAVLAVDTNRRLIKVNRSAEALFRISLPPDRQPEIATVIRNADLLHLINEALAASTTVERDVYLASGDRYLNAHGTALHGADGGKSGAVVVLHDVTRLRRLETMRRDFVANVSHELKTPITSIKGFAETLIEGAAENKEDRDRFLGIIGKQADRLHSIIEDLLALSRIEHDAEKNDIVFTRGRVDRVLEKAVQMSLPRAAEAGIRLTLACDSQLEAEINVQLLEQAVLNLIDNAIKYSGSGTDVVVGGKEEEDRVAIRVTDRGMGIPARHLPRIFERFYRVDSSRSRSLGGTGLGLAIVKRIALAHGGEVDVKSEVNQGSVFSIFLRRPMAPHPPLKADEGQPAVLSPAVLLPPRDGR